MTVPRGQSVGWDLPPLVRAGMSVGTATVAARYLAEQRSGSVGRLAAVNGWITQHAMSDGWSCFSFWAPRFSAEATRDISSAARRTRVDAVLLEEVKRTHLAHAARLSNDPSYAIEQALHTAAWSEHRCPDADDGEVFLDRVNVHTVQEYLAAVVPQASLTVVDAEAEPSMPAPQQSMTNTSTPRWVGGLKLVQRPWAQVIVGIQVCFDPMPGGAAALTVLRELLGGWPDGLLAHELRTARGLAYAAGAEARVAHGRATMLACANTSADQVHDCAEALTRIARRLVEIPARSWRVAARRAKLAATEALEQPFAAVEERRRARSGSGTRQALIASVEQAAEHLVARPPVPSGHIGRAVIGRLDDACLDKLRHWS